MMIDAVLTLITVLVAIVGTVTKDPSQRVKAFLITLAVLAGLGSIVKAASDNADKAFMDTALTSTLIPTNASYQKLTDEVEAVAKKHDFNDTSCVHSADGMSCFLSQSHNFGPEVLVFDKLEIAKMYGNLIRKNDNSRLVEESFGRSFADDSRKEELLDKVGILESSIYFQVFKGFPTDSYNYDDDFGVQITFERNGRKETVGLSPKELSSYDPKRAATYFGLLTDTFRNKLEQLQP